MKVHLVDGTYELFRHYYAVPQHISKAGEEVGAARSVVYSMLSLLAEGATHIAVATDHVIESFRNDLWEDYKDSTGVEPQLLSQFGLLEDALRAVGLTVWPMIEYEADDALACGAALCAADPRVEQVILCTPDKDLAQCVRGNLVVQYDRRWRRFIDETEVLRKFGVLPESIPDYLALTGDSADGFPGLPGWGSRTAAAVLSRYRHLEQIPESVLDWELSVRGAHRLSAIFFEKRELAFHFRRLATLVAEGPVNCSVDDLEWKGPTSNFPEMCVRLEASDLAERAASLVTTRPSTSLHPKP